TRLTPQETAMAPAPGRIELQPIWHVRTAYRRVGVTTTQNTRHPHPPRTPGEPGRLVVEEPYPDALDGLEGFDYAHLICFLDQVWEADDRGTRPFAGDRLRPGRLLLPDTGPRGGGGA